MSKVEVYRAEGERLARERFDPADLEPLLERDREHFYVQLRFREARWALRDPAATESALDRQTRAAAVGEYINAMNPYDVVIHVILDTAAALLPAGLFQRLWDGLMSNLLGPIRRWIDHRSARAHGVSVEAARASRELRVRLLDAPSDVNHPFIRFHRAQARGLLQIYFSVGLVTCGVLWLLCLPLVLLAHAKGRDAAWAGARHQLPLVGARAARRFPEGP